MRYRALIIACLVFCLGVFTLQGPASAENSNRLTYDEIQRQSYLDVKGSGTANLCPSLESSDGTLPLNSGESYRLTSLCLEPTEFYVKEEPINKRAEATFVPGKLVTRETDTIDQVSGPLSLSQDGTLTFTEEDGFDFQAATVKTPAGELVPFMFTVKRLVATSASGQDGIDASTSLSGRFKVPSYRGSAFLDPKGRGIATGYDNAVALPARADDGDYDRTNAKRFVSGQGEITLNVSQIDSETGEIAGTFESEQPSDTDLGAADPEEVKVLGIFYGRVE
jgi:photosystem II oxygen-evolving enhancer protein 1